MVALAFGTRGRFSVVVYREKRLLCFVCRVAKPGYETVRVHLAAVNTSRKCSVTWQKKKENINEVKYLAPVNPKAHFIPQHISPHVTPSDEATLHIRLSLSCYKLH